MKNLARGVTVLRGVLTATTNGLLSGRLALSHWNVPPVAAQIRIGNKQARIKGKESSMSNQPEQFMTQGELAFRWKVSEATLERDRSLKQGCPYMKLGGLIRYRLQDVIGYENECTRQPSKPKPKKVNKPLDSEVILSTARASITRIYQDEWVARDQDVLDFARAIERAHGIGGEA